MPISDFQSAVLRLLARQRSPDSDIAGGIVINRAGPRFSEDIDIFHDSADRQDSAVEADEAALTAAGYRLSWPPRQRTGKHQTTISKNGEHMLLEWVTDSAFRFFPAQPDPLFGYVLHPVDLATNKASAAADRRVPRDVVDLVTIHETILPLGAVVAASVGRGFRECDQHLTPRPPTPNKHSARQTRTNSKSRAVPPPPAPHSAPHPPAPPDRLSRN